MPSPTAVLVTLSVCFLVALPVFSSPTTGTIPHLLARQTASDIPSACRSACNAVLKTLETCSTLQCACTNKNGKDFSACLNCVATQDSTFTSADAASTMGEFVRQCTDAGYNVGTGGGGGSEALNPFAKNAATRSGYKYGVVLGAFVGGLILLV